MNYGGPDPLQQLQQLWHNAVNEPKSPEPKCKARMIPWGGDKLLKMFAMCCGKVPKNTGPGSRDRLRVSYRRIDCHLCKYLIEGPFSNLFSDIIDHHSFNEHCANRPGWGFRYVQGHLTRTVHLTLFIVVFVKTR